MIVTCEECSTSFQLDEARIPATGAQVRCSRCKHAFFLPNPSASEAEQVHSIAEEAASATEGVVPAATSDLATESPEDSSGGSSSLSGSAPEPDLDEDDWEFTEEIRVEGDDDLGEEFTEELDTDFGEDLGVDLDSDSDFGENEDFGEGFDESALVAEVSTSAIESPTAQDEELAVNIESTSEAVPGLELDAASDADEVQRDESSFGSVDDFSELMEDEEPAVAVDLASEIASELEQEATAQDASAAVLDQAGADDLGDPDSWDLVGSDDFAAVPASQGAGERTFSAASAVGPVDAAEFFSDGGLGDVAYDDDLASSSALAGILARAGKVAGWLTSGVLVGAVLVFALQAEWARWAQTTQVAVNGPLRAETISSGWVESSRSGAILRFEGQLRNTGAQAIWPGVIQLALLDGRGERLTTAPILAGAPVAETILREAAPAVLEAESAEALRRLGSTPLAPGEVRTFEALVLEAELPAQAQRVLLEVGESSLRSVRARTQPPPPERADPISDVAFEAARPSL